MTVGSLGSTAGRDLEHAEAERKRRVRDGLCFASVRHALRFYFERGPSMQAPLGAHPRGHLGPDGKRHYIRVDGGRGGDIDEVLSTLSSIHAAMEKLRAALPVEHGQYVLWLRDGVSFSKIGQRSKRAASMVSADVGKAESFLLALLRDAEVVIPEPVRAGGEGR